MSFNLDDLQKDMTKMQDSFRKMEKELNDLRITGESGGGLVKITVNGSHEVATGDVSINPSVMDDDKEMLEDLVAAAINDAAQKLKKTMKDKFAGMAGGLDMNLPGFDDKDDE